MNRHLFHGHQEVNQNLNRAFMAHLSDEQKTAFQSQFITQTEPTALAAGIEAHLFDEQ